MIITCHNWSESPEFFRGKCAAGKYAGRPTLGECIDLCLKTNRSELAAYMRGLAAAQPQAKPAVATPAPPAQVAAARAICLACRELVERECCGGAAMRSCTRGNVLAVLDAGGLPNCPSLADRRTED